MKSLNTVAILAIAFSVTLTFARPLVQKADEDGRHVAGVPGFRPPAIEPLPPHGKCLHFDGQQKYTISAIGGNDRMTDFRDTIYGAAPAIRSLVQDLPDNKVVTGDTKAELCYHFARVLEAMTGAQLEMQKLKLVEGAKEVDLKDINDWFGKKGSEFHFPKRDANGKILRPSLDPCWGVTFNGKQRYGKMTAGQIRKIVGAAQVAPTSLEKGVLNVFNSIQRSGLIIGKFNDRLPGELKPIREGEGELTPIREGELPQPVGDPE